MVEPCYSLAHQGVTKFGMDVCLSSVQKITDRLAERCEELGHENLIIEPRYDVEDKTIIISVDGGRSRMRKYTDQLNENGQATYQTPWREPKLFVIDVLAKDGRPDRQELPIYGCQLKEEDVIKLLGRYLKKLDIQKAKRVQLIADGAPWIWNRLPALLRHVGVEKQRLIQTLDFYTANEMVWASPNYFERVYTRSEGSLGSQTTSTSVYHATQYVHSLVQAMPKCVGKKERKQHLKKFMEQVKGGQIKPLVIKRWPNGNKEKLLFYVTPLLGSFCHCPIYKDEFAVMNADKVFMPIGEYQLDESIFNKDLLFTLLPQDLTRIPVEY